MRHWRHLAQYPPRPPMEEINATRRVLFEAEALTPKIWSGRILATQLNPRTSMSCGTDNTGLKIMEEIKATHARLFWCTGAALWKRKTLKCVHSVVYVVACVAHIARGCPYSVCDRVAFISSIGGCRSAHLEIVMSAPSVFLCSLATLPHAC